jgi:hypothetical protein
MRGRLGRQNVLGVAPGNRRLDAILLLQHVVKHAAGSAFEGSHGHQNGIFES